MSTPSSSKSVSSQNPSPFEWMRHVRYEHMVAGVAGGVTATLVLHPLDLLKVRYAANDGTVSTRPVYNSLLQAISTIRREEGFRGLYRGVTPNCFGAGASWGFYFLFYHSIKGYMGDGDPTVELGPGHHMCAAAVAGTMTLVLTNPIWVVKTRLCLQYGPIDKLPVPAYKKYHGMMDAFSKVYRYEGIVGLYKGFFPGIIGVSHGALQFMAYEQLKKSYNRRCQLPDNSKLNTLEYLTFAALSKLFAASITYPYQVLRARLQDHYTNYKGVVDVFLKTLRREGVRGFYKGLTPNLTRVVPATMITFVVHENLHRILMDARKTQAE